VFPGYTADDQKPRLVSCSRRDFDQIGISPERLGIDEIDVMFFQICPAFSLVEFENKRGIENIPLLCFYQRGSLSPSLIISRRLPEYCRDQSCAVVLCHAVCNGRPANSLNKNSGLRMQSPPFNQLVTGSNPV
jgi:hypothetical protein